VRKQKAFFLFLISIIILSFLFSSCDTSQIKTSEAETTVTSIEEIAVAEVITTEETSDKENKTAITTITNNEEKEEITAQATVTTEITTAETKTSETNQPLKVHFINVGQGDSILIVTPEGNTMLIDGGPKDSGADLVSYLKKQGINKINVIVATHPHEDHIGGLINVINSFQVDNIIDSGVSHTTQTYKNYLSAIQSKNINFVNWSLGQQFDFGDNINFTIVGPITKSSSDLNNSSIVIYFKYKSSTFLFAGDAESTEENKIISSGAILNADVLKVGHHGSDSSSSSKFLKAVSPSIAVISCGKSNSYGHPHNITLKNLTAIGANIYRTDTTGNIVIECDGNSLKVISGKPYTYVETKTTETTQVAETTAAETTATETTVTETTQEQPAQNGAYVGSAESDKFHKPNCRYVKQILPENIIWFSSREDALAQGYIPCKVCKP
jgi:competence protein ComEC